MRRSLTRAAGIVVRLVLLAATALMLASVAVVWCCPGVVDDLGDRWKAGIEQDYAARWQTVANEGDPRRRRQALRTLADELATVRKEDRLATLVRLVERARGELALGEGDIDDSLSAARRLVAMDDRDVDAIAFLGRILGVRSHSRPEGRALLAAALARLPACRPLVEAALDLAVAAADWEAAAAILVRACVAAPSGMWHVADADDPRRRTWFTTTRTGMDGITAAFRIPAASPRVRFELPQGRGLLLTDATLTIEGAAGATTWPLVDLRPALHGVRWLDDGLCVEGDGPVTLELSLPADAGGRACTLRARLRPRLPRWLADRLRQVDPRLLKTREGDRLTPLHRRAWIETEWQVTWHTPGRAPDVRTIAADARAAPDGATGFAVPLRPPTGAVGLRLGLPMAPPTNLVLSHLRWCGRELPANTRFEQLQLLNDALLPIGPDPAIVIDLSHASTTPEVLLEGVLR